MFINELPGIVVVYWCITLPTECEALQRYKAHLLVSTQYIRAQFNDRSEYKSCWMKAKGSNHLFLQDMYTKCTQKPKHRNTSDWRNTLPQLHWQQTTHSSPVSLSFCQAVNLPIKGRLLKLVKAARSSQCSCLHGLMEANQHTSEAQTMVARGHSSATQDEPTKEGQNRGHSWNVEICYKDLRMKSVSHCNLHPTNYTSRF